jgi:hypothetical protein
VGCGEKCWAMEGGFQFAGLATTWLAMANWFLSRDDGSARLKLRASTNETDLTLCGGSFHPAFLLKQAATSSGPRIRIT